MPSIILFINSSCVPSLNSLLSPSVDICSQFWDWVWFFVLFTRCFAFYTLFAFLDMLAHCYTFIAIVLPSVPVLLPRCYVKA